VAVVGLLAALFPSAAGAAPSVPVSFTILHTNDFHGQLEASGSNPGSARVAAVVNDVRNALPTDSVLLFDIGDEMQGSLLSNLQKGAPVIATYNAMGYDAATFGNHEFDWGKDVLTSRVGEAAYPYVSANIVAGACSGWTAPSFATPYVVQTVGTAPNQVKVGIIGVTSIETPTITIASATDGLCFKDPAESILHYYDELKAQSDVVVVLSHIGFEDGGYGYGIPVYGDKTLAQKLIDAGKPANLIIGGHSHTNLAAATVVGSTSVVQAYYNGRKVGRADVTVATSGAVTVNWQSLAVSTTGAKDPTIDALVTSYANDTAYQALINTPVGYARTDLLRNYNGDSMMGDFVDDAIYGWLNSDAEPTNDVDLFLNNAGGIRIDWCDAPDPVNPGAYIWSSTAADCQPGVWAHDPMVLNYGQMFQILPFGNQTIVGEMTGAQVLELLNQSATLFKGSIQPAGMRFGFYRYADALPGPQPWAWGAFDACVIDKADGSCDPLDLDKVYRVGTNEFLAPAGQDGYVPFKYMTNITYWGDMLNAVNAWVAANHGTPATAYKGPNNDGQLDGRISRDGTDTTGSILPVTILHHNDSHGNLAKGSYVGYTQLATLIKEERAHNPDRTILLSGGDNIQGDAMSYYFKSAPLGYAADGTPLDPALQVQPLIAAFNAIGYDAMTLGNHEFNFGSEIFTAVLKQAAFPVLGANVADTGAYGLAEVGVKPYIERTVGAEEIKLGIVGITNHRVPNYELPSNIEGLAFSDPLASAQQWATKMRPIENLVAKVKYFYKEGLIKKAGVRNSLLTKLASVQRYIDAGNTTAAVATLRAFVNEVKAQKGKAITAYAANTLITLGTWAQKHAYDDDVVIALTHIGFTTNPKSVEVDENVDTAMAAKTRGLDAIIGSHSHTNPANPEAPYKLLPTIAAGPGNTPVIINQAYRYNNTLGEVVVGLRASSGGWEVAAQAGRYISVAMTTAEDPEIKAIVDPYVAILNAYNNTVVGQTTAPIDALKAYTEETTGANLQADASVWELADNEISVDFHLSGAMSNRKVADGATPAVPVTLKVADMFTLMPYENSLVVMEMTGPQLKTVLERAYRNYYYYKYVPGYGGYSYYTTCMLDTNAGNIITYDEKGDGGLTPPLPDGSNVVSLVINGVPVDFADSTKRYRVSTVNYLAAGSCNFNDGGVSLWPLAQITDDTQYYVRDAVINYISEMDTVSPAIEGRLVFMP
jgi:2',3'-cyclic-nucleotide 2'-phosphodiesterase (5'-nucleotidase family)